MKDIILAFIEALGSDTIGATIAALVVTALVILMLSVWGYNVHASNQCTTRIQLLATTSPEKFVELSANEKIRLTLCGNN